MRYMSRRRDLQRQRQAMGVLVPLSLHAVAAIWGIGWRGTRRSTPPLFVGEEQPHPLRGVALVG